MSHQAFLYPELVGKEILYENRKIKIEKDLPQDFCPYCEYFEEDILPFCTKQTPNSFKIKLNGNEIEVYCPKQIEYILEKYSRKT